MQFKDFNTVHILSVDDNEFNQEFVIAIFEEFNNIKILQAFNGNEGLEVLEKEVVDIILLDLMMPEMNGFEMLKRVKSNIEYKSIPVIIVTSKEDEKRATYQLGANDFISKPYGPEELKLRIFNHLHIKIFSDLIYEIEDSSRGESASSNNTLKQIKTAIEIALGTQKKLLAKLGDMAHENSQRDNEASIRMGEYAKLLAQLYGLSSKEIDNLYYTMSIYDIGLLRVPKEKRANVNSLEFREYPNLGLSIIEDLDESSLVKMAKEVILSHRENWDGSGYPNSLKGEEIPLYARIASIVDFYDELTVERVYTENIFNSTEALEIMKRESAIRFDPNVLELFVQNFSRFRDLKSRYA